MGRKNKASIFQQKENRKIPPRKKCVCRSDLHNKECVVIFGALLILFSKLEAFEADKFTPPPQTDQALLPSEDTFELLLPFALTAVVEDANGRTSFYVCSNNSK